MTPARRLVPALTVAGLALAGVLLVGTAAADAAELRCDPPGNLLRWPDERPVWELCWLFPDESSGPSGSGLELRDVRFRGVTVMARAHLPALWAELGRPAVPADGPIPGCSGRCLRTWAWEASEYGVRGEIVPGYYEIELDRPPSPPSPLTTACDRPPGAAPGSCPWGEAVSCGQGVAMERWEDGFRLTTQLEAGWFRYVQRWTFHRDGTIEPRLGFARGGAACAGAPTVDAAVWRLDLDVAGRRNRVSELEGAGPARRITAPIGGLGYELQPGASDGEPSVWVSTHAAGELTDAGRGCAFDPAGLTPRPSDEEEVTEGEAHARNRPRPFDAVLWYRASASDVAQAGCRWVGPTLVPVGQWPREPGEELFGDGFESGGLDAWSKSAESNSPGSKSTGDLGGSPVNPER